MDRLKDLINKAPYSAYSYSYPHKTAYRKFDNPFSLEQLWKNEKRDSLFLYIHIPFCEKRCGFCNLLTIPKPMDELKTKFINALKDQAKAMSELTKDFKFSRFAMGGGTPTYLDPDELKEVFDIAKNIMGADLINIPGSVEASPQTLTSEKLEIIKQNGIDRLSLGIQSFIEDETKRISRPQKDEVVDRVINEINSLDFPVLNLDLIYGIPGQTKESWEYSLNRAIDYNAGEIYIYPLYVRPLTGMGKSKSLNLSDDPRQKLYEFAVEKLTNSGYTQVSMRMFKKDKDPSATDAPLYCCQEDGMIGLGPGARSYTKTVHYSCEYAVERKAVCEIIEDYCNTSKQEFALAPHGIELDESEQKRRYIIKSILTKEGLLISDYKDLFNTNPMTDFPNLHELEELGLSIVSKEKITLTKKGIGLSDAIGPWLISNKVKQRMDDWDLK